jgi:hypothetical protein
MQGESPGVEVRGLRVQSNSGLGFSSCHNCKILGSKFDATTQQRLSSGMIAVSCSGVTPGYYYVPWNSTQYTYWQLLNVPPRTDAPMNADGCVDLVVQDTEFKRLQNSGGDIFGMESSTRTLIERAKFFGVLDMNHDNMRRIWGSDGSDATDIKGVDFKARWIEIRGGRTGLKMWMGYDVDHAFGWSSYGSDQGALGGVSQFANSGLGHEFPQNHPFRTVRYVYNEPNSPYAIAVLSKIGSGAGAMVDAPVTFSGVPGCTGINGNKLISSIIVGLTYPNVFRIKNMDGSPFYCPDAYDLAQHTFREWTGLATTFSAGAADITVTGISSDAIVHDRIRFSTTGTLPAGLTPGTDYYIVYKSGSIIRISATRGGTAFTTPSGGTGAHTSTIVDEASSYAGFITLQPYVTAMNHSTFLARGVKIGYQGTVINATNGGVNGPKYSLWNSLFADQAQSRALKDHLVMTAMPAVAFTASSSTINVEYFDDAGTLAVGAVVYFHGINGLPTAFTQDTPYYIVAADSSAKTIEVATSPGGSAVVANSSSEPTGTTRFFLRAPGFTSTKVSVASTGSNDAQRIDVGDTVRVVTWDKHATPPYPLVKGQSYYVSSSSTGSMSGSSYQWVELKNSISDPAPIIFRQYNRRPEVFLQTDSAASSPQGGTVWAVSNYNNLQPSGNNFYYDEFLTFGKYGIRNYLYGSGNMTSQAQLDQQETGSLIGGTNPHLDYEWTGGNAVELTGRATASSPTTTWNRGYYSGTNTVESAAERQIVRWRAPAASDSCTVVLDDSSNFSSPVETIVSPAGHRWREVVFGTSTLLTPATTYYHKITCGYDVFTGSAATLAAPGSLTTLAVTIGPPPVVAATQAAVDTSLDGSIWSEGTLAACSDGCSLTSNQVRIGQAYRIRTRRVSAGGVTLATEQARLMVVE